MSKEKLEQGKTLRGYRAIASKERGRRRELSRINQELTDKLKIAKEALIKVMKEHENFYDDMNEYVDKIYSTAIEALKAINDIGGEDGKIK